MSNLVIVAIPDENDRVWKVSSEKVPHLTICFLGDVDNISPNSVEAIVAFAMHAADTMLNRFILPVDRRGQLGEDQADVLFFKKGRYDYKAIRDFRTALLQDNNIKKAYDSTTQFDGPWNPHLTLGYPATPAKSMPEEFSTFYDVQFNKVAVWTEDFDGPEFLLTDYWDEADTMEVAPMDVAMSDIRHHGVKGMRWGVRREDVARAAESSTSKIGAAVREAHRFAGDVAFESKTAPGKDETGPTASEATSLVANAARKPFKNEDLPALKARHPNAGFGKRLLKPLSKEAKAYRKDARETYIKRLETTANSMKNPSGTREYTIREKGGDLPKSRYVWEVSSREARHAAGDSVIELEIVMDADGYITDLKPTENSMAQTMDLGAAFLEHHGVKGMKWGVRREETAGGGHIRISEKTGMAAVSKPVAAAVVGTAVIMPVLLPAAFLSKRVRSEIKAANTQNKKARADKKWQKELSSAKKAVEVHNKSGDEINAKLPAFNSDKRWKNPDGTDIHLPSNPAKQQEYDRAAMDEIINPAYARAAIAVHGSQSPSGRYKFTIEDPSTATMKVTDTVLQAKEREAQHAATEDGSLTVTFKILRDKNGHISGFKPEDEEDTLAQAIELGGEFILEHYGIKGMRWGVRRARAVTTQTHIDTGLRRRKTQIETRGGESQPAHDDAVKAAVAKQVVKKSGTDALSTQELRDLANRLQVENQVSLLMSSKGKQFVQGQLEGEGKKALKKGIREGAGAATPHVVKKVKKGAATAATIGALAL